MRKALVVDDIKGIQLLLRRCLEAENFSVETCGDGRRALEILTTEPFDLIVLDIKLPHVSGTDVLKQIREYGIQTPVIIITAFGSIRNEIDCTKLGVISYIQKPFSEHRVLAVLEEFCLRGNPSTRSENEEVQPTPGTNQWTEQLATLQSRLAQEPLNSDLYRQLAKTSRKLEKEQEAEQYEKIYRSFGQVETE